MDIGSRLVLLAVGLRAYPRGVYSVHTLTVLAATSRYVRSRRGGLKAADQVSQAKLERGR